MIKLRSKVDITLLVTITLQLVLVTTFTHEALKLSPNK